MGDRWGDRAMNNPQRHFGTAAGGGRAGFTPSGVSTMIRQAEKYMEEGKFSLAMDELKRAQQIEPQNVYIHAIMERARLLEASTRDSDGPGRYLSVTVGKQFEGGIKSHRDDVATPEQTRMRIRELTETAHILLNRGLSESAFDTLMKAYLLDPLNPDVISAEKRVLPAWEMAQKQKRGTMDVQGVARAETLTGHANPSPSGSPVAEQPESPEEKGVLGFFRRRR